MVGFEGASFEFAWKLNDQSSKHSILLFRITVLLEESSFFVQQHFVQLWSHQICINTEGRACFSCKLSQGGIPKRIFQSDLISVNFQSISDRHINYRFHTPAMGSLARNFL